MYQHYTYSHTTVGSDCSPMDPRPIDAIAENFADVARRSTHTATTIP